MSENSHQLLIYLKYLVRTEQDKERVRNNWAIKQKIDVMLKRYSLFIGVDQSLSTKVLNEYLGE